jgi:hypothetical protein
MYGEAVVKGGHVGADDEPRDVEGALGGVVDADDVEDGRALGDVQPGGLGTGGHPGGDLLLDLSDGGYGVDAGDVAARSAAGEEVGNFSEKALQDFVPTNPVTAFKTIREPDWKNVLGKNQ